jgi:hypothetical protein
MNRTFTTLLVLALVLVAVALCVKQTIDFRDEFSGTTAALLFSGEGIFGGGIVAASFSLIRKRFARQKKPITHRPVAAAA